MSNRSTVVVALSIVLFAAWFVRNYVEYYQEDIDAGWSEVAKTNPFLAAESYLEQLGAKVSTADQLADLEHLPNSGTLLVSDIEHVVSARQFEKVASWLEGGGHLIVEAKQGKIDNMLFDYFGAYMERTDYDFPECVPKTINTGAAENSKTTKNPDEADPPSEQAAKADDIKSFGELLREANDDIGRGGNLEAFFACEFPPVAESDLTIYTYGDGRQIANEELRAFISPEYELIHPSLVGETENDELIYAAGTAYGFHMLQLRYGDGQVTLVADSGIWQNERIGEFQHAHLLWHLSGEGKPVVILQGHHSPSLFILLWRAVPELILTLMLWLVFWLVFRGRRFGPVQRWEQRGRRSMAEHIHAGSRYLWRFGEPEDLIKPLREDIARAAQRYFSGFYTLEFNAQINLLAEHSGLKSGQVEIAMRAKIEHNEADFTDAIRLLQELRKSL